MKIDALVNSMEFLHSNMEKPILFKEILIFLNNKKQRKSETTVIGKLINDTGIIQLNNPESKEFYYLPWYSTVDKWVYIDDIKNVFLGF